MEDLIYYAWLLGFIVLAALAVYLKDDKKKVVIQVLLVYATAFVLLQAYRGILSRANANLAYTRADRAELYLKMSSGYIAMESYMPSMPSLKEKMESPKEQFYKEAEELLGEAVESAPKSTTLLTKQIILYGDQGKSVKKPLKQLRAVDGERAKKAEELARLLEAVYVTKKVKSSDYDALRKIADQDVSAGWYREIVTMQLVKNAGRTKQFKEMHADFHERYVYYMARLGAFGIAAVLCFLVGAIIIFIQLFFLPRKPTDENGLKLIRAPSDWSGKAVYGVFIGWLSIEFLLSVPLKSIASQMANIASEHGVIAIALLTAGLYLFQNLPSILLIWLLAIRPHKLPFFESLKLRLKVENRGIFKLVTAGILTWYACIPLVVLSVYISTKLGSQGSDNPIVAVVMAAAKEANPLGIVLFIFALGVLPGLIEELLFRGFLYTSLRRKFSIFPSLVISAAVFSVIHLDLGGALQLFCLGFLFAFILEKTRSLVPSMVAHCLWNSCTFIMALVAYG